MAGRPRKEVDPTAVTKLARLGCSGEEISSVLRIDRATLYRNYATALKEGHDNQRCSLRRLQWKSANAGNVTMQIWLGKQLLGQADKSEFTGSVKHEHVDLTKLSDQQLTEVEKIIESASVAGTDQG